MGAEELVASLVAIDSVNPDLVEDGAGEPEVAEFVAGWLRDAGLEVELDEAASGRTSVIGVAPGTGGGRSLMLNGHLDTVGVEGMERPFEPVVRDGRLYGRGAYDMKAGVAACMLAASRLRQEELAGDVVVAAVADEEYASIGTQSVLRRRRTDAAIVTEPTGLRVCVAHKGFAWAELETRGRAAHGSRPAEGEDALARMAPALTRLAELESSLASAAGHELVGPGSVHASLIEGGQELSSYPARCVLSLERRTIPGETAADVRRECEALVAGIEDAAARLGIVREPFSVDPSADVVQAIAAAAAAVTGRPGALYGETYWMDAALIQAAGIPTAVFGPGGEGAHAVEEWVDLGSVEACADALFLAARALCG